MITLDWNAIEASACEVLDREGWKGLTDVCELLKQRVPHYQWVGIYWMNSETQELYLGPFAGAETEHTRIPFGRGICGQVAVSGQTFEVPDVWAQDNYLACSMETKAELVVPIYRGDRLIGQIDIDSHYLNPFVPEDEALLRRLAAQIAALPEAGAIG